MDLQYLKKIIRLIEQSTVDEIEIEEEGIKIRIAKNSPNGMAQPMYYAPPAGTLPVSAPPSTAASPDAAAATAPVIVATNHHEVKSPIVGTFYRSPAPDADSYVEVGQMVEKGTVLCIIEAMKLMNEIEADISGRLIRCCVDNAKPVEYNQPLFIIEPV